MRYGFFTMPVHPQGRPYWQTLKEDREAFILADRLGYSEGYCGEHLTDAVENIPNSMMFIATLLVVPLILLVRPVRQAPTDLAHAAMD